MDQMKYLKELAVRYPNVAAASTEIINLQAISHLPKGTEHYVSDVHGEYEKFSHIIRNGSGAIRSRIEDEFGNTLTTKQKKNLASVIYYPEQKMDLMEEELPKNFLLEWQHDTMVRLVHVARSVGNKYTRSKVRKAMSPEFAYVMEELMVEHRRADKKRYVEQILETIIMTGRVRQFIAAMAHLIQDLTIDHLHVIGDIYDRGSGPHRIMDCIMKTANVDIQWGNHDVLWMGAFAGQPACIANIVRTSLLYDNLSVLENGYGISMMPLVLFAMETYADDPCAQFTIRSRHGSEMDTQTVLAMKMHKAITIIQFKLEGQLIAKHPEYNMDNRRLLDKIDADKGTVTIDGKEYPMLDRYFPTIDFDNPYELTSEEQSVIAKLSNSFVNCAKLKSHINLLLQKGSLYKVCNNNLLFHGCIPMNEDGSFRNINLFGEDLCGKELYDELERCARKAFFSVNEEEKRVGRDILWFLWNGADSPLYGRDKMTTFERYFIADESTHKEIKDVYYRLFNDEEVVDRIFKMFGIKGDNAHIINGHVPIHHTEGESPVKCNGKVIIIDGGFSQPYHKVTGIAGYTLIYNSYGLMLTAHEPFKSVDYTIRSGRDMQTNQVATEVSQKRILVGDTDNGKKIRENIKDLKDLIKPYRNGTLRQNQKN